MRPIVYVETNWLIAYLFPHERRHRGAKELLDCAERNDCDLRVPLISFIEAHGTMSRVGTSFSDELERVREKLKNVYDAGWAGFNGEQFMLSVTNDAYFTRNLVDLLEKLKNNQAVTHFSHPTDEVSEIGKLGLDLRLYTSDMKDLYILAAILVDLRKIRQQEPDRPALFLSSNEKEFSPKKSKVTQAFYEHNKLLYWSEFKDLQTSIGKWYSLFPQP
ncbi:MAG TPA: hypothetical protein PK156_22685 [Polyangium sp.]|nr:hypothetical protein [Polyangium sp.]